MYWGNRLTIIFSSVRLVLKQSPQVDWFLVIMIRAKLSFTGMLNKLILGVGPALLVELDKFDVRNVFIGDTELWFNV